MALTAATAETWGISGPEFLLVYLAIAVVVLVAGTRARRALADPGATSPVGDLTAHPHDVAYLNGGPELAVYSALSAMHLRGTIAGSGGGNVRAARAPRRPTPTASRRPSTSRPQPRCSAGGSRSTGRCRPRSCSSSSAW